jgi:hypothetical protein
VISFSPTSSGIISIYLSQNFLSAHCLPWDHMYHSAPDGSQVWLCGQYHDCCITVTWEACQDTFMSSIPGLWITNLEEDKDSVL